METRIIRINSLAESIDDLQYCAKVIKDGGLVVFPTETVYGLGANATSTAAARRIYEAKGRPSDNPLIIHIATPNEAEEYAYTSDIYYRLAEKFMPGPLTVIMKAKETVPPTTRGGLDTVAIRCPENPIANKLISLVGMPIAAPSANLSGTPSPTKASHVIDDMMGRVEVIIDGGDCEFGLESTIVKIENDGSLTLLRPGRITPDDLTSVTKRVNISSAVLNCLNDKDKVESPGMKYKHYAPKAPFYLLDGDMEAAISFLKDKKNAAFICYQDYVDVLCTKIPWLKIYPFGYFGDESKQAKLLFSILREADKDGNNAIYAMLPRETGIGLALYNRMIRAASHTIIKLK